MSQTYGYIASEKQLPYECKNETTMEYYMRNAAFIRLVENTKDACISCRKDSKILEWRYDEKRSLKKARQFGVSFEEGRHIDVLESFISCLETGSRIMFMNIEDISKSSEAALHMYRKFSNNGIRLQFLNQPWLNNEIFVNALIEYPGMNCVVQRIIDATFKGNDNTGSYLTLLSQTESNAAKKNGEER